MEEKLVARAAERRPTDAATLPHRVGVSRPSRRTSSHELATGPGTDTATAIGTAPESSDESEHDDQFHAYAGFGIIVLTLLVFVGMTLRL